VAFASLFLCTFVPVYLVTVSVKRTTGAGPGRAIVIDDNGLGKKKIPPDRDGDGDGDQTPLDWLAMKWLRRLPEAPVTSALIVANLAVYAWMVVSSGTVLGFDTATMIFGGANVVGTHQDVSHWRLLTAAFVHFHLLHLGMNMWVLAQIGVISERTIGSGVIAAAYVATGVTGNVASTLFYGWRQQPTHTAGASGAIMGLIGITALFAWRTGQKGIARALMTNFGFLLVMGLVLNFDNAAHVGGFVGGALVGLVRARWQRPLPRWLDAVLIGSSGVLTIAAFAIVHSYRGVH
jgi:membrane associated rhomboid family serine protease